MKHSTVFILLIGLISISIVASSDVIDLTSSNFDSVVYKSKLPVLVEFFAPWCKHCKDLAPTYEQVATNLKGLAVVAKVDATVEESLASRHGIRGFPTLKLWKPGGKQGQLEDYQGARSASAIVSFVTNALRDEIFRLKSSNFDDLFNRSPASSPRVILFTSKKEPSNLYKSLSMRFKDQLAFAQVIQNDPLCQQYKIETFPTLIVQTSKDDQDVIKYDGKFNAESLIPFLEQYALKEEQKGSKTQNSKDGKSTSQNQANDNQNQPKVKMPVHTTPETFKEASNWHSLNENCGNKYCIVLMENKQKDHTESSTTAEEQDLSSLKSKVLSLYGKDGKFNFVHFKSENHEDSQIVLSKFYLENKTDLNDFWIIYNGKKSKFAVSESEQVPSALLDRIISGDAKLSKLRKSESEM